MHLIWEAPVFLGRDGSQSMITDIRRARFRRAWALATALVSVAVAIMLMLGGYLLVGPRWAVALFLLNLVCTRIAAKKYDKYDYKIKRWERLADQDLDNLSESLGQTYDRILTANVESLKVLARQKLLDQEQAFAQWKGEVKSVTIHNASAFFTNQIWDFIEEEEQRQLQKTENLRQIFQEFQLLDD